jgi:hypothetical protein
VVREEHHPCVVCLGSRGEQVEEGIIVKEEVLKVAILRADHIGTLDWIPAEEDGLDKVRAV